MLPPEVRPLVPQPGSLGRKALGQLRRVLVEVIGELEAAWERRNRRRWPNLRLDAAYAVAASGQEPPR